MDVCGVLGLENDRQVTANLLGSEAGVHSMDIRSANGVVQKRDLTFVNESVLYQNIFKSKKPKAKEFCAR